MKLRNLIEREVRFLEKNSDFRTKEIDDVYIVLKIHNEEYHIHSSKDFKSLMLSIEHEPYVFEHIVQDDEMANRLINDAYQQFNIDQNEKIIHPIELVQKKLPERLIFRNKQQIGDILMMTCAVRDFKNAYPNIKIKVETTASHIWDNNPYLEREETSLKILL